MEMFAGSTESRNKMMLSHYYISDAIFSQQMPIKGVQPLTSKFQLTFIIINHENKLSHFLHDDSAEIETGSVWHECFMRSVF